MELTFDNSLEIHEDWVFEVAGKLRSAYDGDVERFSLSHGIDYLDAFWFFKGNPVRSDAFKAICSFLGFDWEKIQLSRQTSGQG